MSSTYPESEQKYLAIIQTVASVVAALTVIFAVATVLQERVQRMRKRDTGLVAAEPDKMGYFYVDHVRWHDALRGFGTKNPNLPTITGLIEAGDAGMWTSAALDQLRPSHTEIGWVELYRAVYNQVVGGPKEKGDKVGEDQEDEDEIWSGYSSEVCRFLERARVYVEGQVQKNIRMKAEWEERQQHLRDVERTLSGTGEPGTMELASSKDMRKLRKSKEVLDQERVFPLRTMLYRPSIGSYEDPDGTKRSFLRRLLNWGPGIVTMGVEGEHQVLQLVDPISEAAHRATELKDYMIFAPELVKCVRPLDHASSPAPRAPIQSPYIPNEWPVSSSETSVQLISQGKDGDIGRSPDTTTGHNSSSSSLRLSRRATLRNWQREPEPPRHTGLNQLQRAWNLECKPCIETSREELAALALVLGMQLKVNESANTVNGIGAFGTSLFAAQSGGCWKLHLIHGTRLPKHLHSQGSGYTTIYAKHLACGSIPFADSTKWIKSVYVRQDVLDAIKRGWHIKDMDIYGGQSLEYLRRLPGKKQIDAFYGVVEHANTPARLGAILRTDGTPVGEGFSWARAVAGIAFGGLVPQATPRVAEAVQFTVSHDQQPETAGARINALEDLVEKLHGLQHEKHIFGPYVAMRYEANSGADRVSYTTAARGPPRDSASKFGRYMNLLERMVARCDAGLNEVYEASCRLIEDSYRRAVELEKARASGLFFEVVGEVTDIAAAVKAIRKRTRRSVRIPYGDIAVVVRCILAVWAEQVPHVELEEFREVSVGDDPLASPRSFVGFATMEDLPAISAFG